MSTNISTNNKSAHHLNSLPKIFFDSSFYIALANTLDTNHQKALSVNNHLENLNYTPYTSNFIMLETVTVISQRIDREAAIHFHNTEVPNVKLIRVSSELEKQAWNIFQQTNNKNISYVDCSILALIAEYRINYLLTYDKHFNKFKKQFDFEVFK